MDAEQEQQCSHAMRELARQYAEGRFNKEEYRNRRRELIARCSGETPTSEASTPPESVAVDPEKGVRVLRIVAMTSVGLMLLMGAIILYLR